MLKTILRHAVVLAAATSFAGCAPVGEEPPFDATGKSEPSDEAEPRPERSATPTEDAKVGPERRTTDLHYMTFGSPEDRPVIFVHGGPGGDASLFEKAAAAELAKRGNFVITYDQRGSGRSPKGAAADFTFERATQDLDDLIGTLGVASPILVGHGWGGTLAVEYLERFGDVAKGAVVIGNPLDYADSIFNLQEQATSILGGSGGAIFQELRARMFPNGFARPFQFSFTDFASTLAQAGAFGLDLPRLPTLDGLATWASVLAGRDRSLGTILDLLPGEAFGQNERLFDRDFAAQYAKSSSRIFGIYGEDDRLMTPTQLTRVRELVSPSHVVIIKRAAQFVFIDRRDEFLDVLGVFLDRLRPR